MKVLVYDRQSLSQSGLMVLHLHIIISFGNTGNTNTNSHSCGTIESVSNSQSKCPRFDSCQNFEGPYLIFKTFDDLWATFGETINRGPVYNSRNFIVTKTIELIFCCVWYKKTL